MPYLPSGLTGFTWQNFGTTLHDTPLCSNLHFRHSMGCGLADWMQQKSAMQMLIQQHLARAKNRMKL